MEITAGSRWPAPRPPRGPGTSVGHTTSCRTRNQRWNESDDPGTDGERKIAGPRGMNRPKIRCAFSLAAFMTGGRLRCAVGQVKAYARPRTQNLTRYM